MDGNTVVVGAPGQDSGAGAVYVYERSGSTWSWQAYLKAARPDAGDRFGESVAISGNTIVVGASYEGSDAVGVNGDQSNNNRPRSGAAYVFVRTGATWSQQAYLKADFVGPGWERFGNSVAIDGNTLVVGAMFYDMRPMELEPFGTAYVFTRSLATSTPTWSQQAHLVSPNAVIGARPDTFGLAVAISGPVIAVGSIDHAWVFELIDSNWLPHELVSAYSAYHTVAVSGNTVAVGLPSGDSSGWVNVFVRNSPGVWSPQAELRASNADPGDLFGASVAISGGTLVAGAPNESSRATGVNADAVAQADNSAVQSGAAYVFVRTGTTWSQQAYLKASNTDASDHFGYSVAASGDTVVVGAPDEDSAATGVGGNQTSNGASGSGAAYVFQYGTPPECVGKPAGNIVGYVRVAVPAGGTMIANPLDNGAANALSVVLPAPPDGSQATFLRSGAPEVHTFTAGAWVPETVAPPGVGFLFMPGAATTTTFVGQVPLGHLVDPVPAGNSYCSSMAPQAGRLQTDLGFPLVNGVVITLYTGPTHSDYVYSGGWWTPAEPQLGVGQGFAVYAPSELRWVRDFAPVCLLGAPWLVASQRPVGDVEISWTGGGPPWRLIQADTVDGPYTAVPCNPASPYVIPAASLAAKKFFGLAEAVAPNQPARLVGQVDMVGEPEVAVPYALVPSTQVSVQRGVGGARQIISLPSPYFGAFALDGLAPSPDYLVGVTMNIRTDRQLETFTSPFRGLGGRAGVNAPVEVLDGLIACQTDLGATFVMHPGYVSGQILLQGPSESVLLHPSALRGVVRTGDDGALPDGESRVAASGDGDRKSEGALYSAAGAQAFASFQGDFSPMTYALDGHYELVLAGLDPPPKGSWWNNLGVNLRLAYGLPDTPTSYVREKLLLTELQNPHYNSRIEIRPDERHPMDLNYCLSEVTLVFEVPGTAQLYAPVDSPGPRVWVDTSGLGLPGAARDFQDNPRRYQVRLENTYGTPVLPARASQGRAVVLLPEGEYNLRVDVRTHTPPDGPVIPTTFSFPKLKVGCGQSLTLTPDLAVEITSVAPCVGGGMAWVQGQVKTSPGNTVSRIERTTPGGGGGLTTIRTDCGSNPTFDFLLPADRCVDTPFTVLVHDASGRSASVTAVVPRDTTKPVLMVAAEKAVECGVASPFDTPGLSDGCGPARLTSISTSLPERIDDSTYAVVRTWEATDDCGNLARASQRVTFVHCHAPPAIPLVPLRSVWRYVSMGAAPPGDWLQAGYPNEPVWDQGFGVFGYGHGSEATPLSYGAQAANKFPTAYFRNTFEMTNPTNLFGAVLRLKCDDGAIVYLNGVEVFRRNMPAGAANFATLAAGATVGPDESVYFETNLNPALLLEGTNVLAVEVHQFSGASPDLAFDLELLGLPAPPPIIGLPLPAGYSAFANNYSRGGNTLNEVLPFVADGTQLFKWDSAAQRYRTNVYDTLSASWVPNETLEPGGGGFIYSPAPQSFTFATPLPQPPSFGVARPGPGLRLASCRAPVTATSFAQLMGFAPMVGDRVLVYEGALSGLPDPATAQPSRAYVFGLSGWLPGEPQLEPGQSAFVDLVAVPPALTPLLQPQSQTVFAGLPVTFTAFGYGAAPVSYRWLCNGQPITAWTSVVSSAFSAELNLPLPDLKDNGNAYSLALSNSFGQTFSSNAVLTVQPVITANLWVSESFENPPNTQVVGVGGGVGWTGLWGGGIPIYNYFTNRAASLVPATLPQYVTAGGSAAIDLPPSSGSYLNRSLDLSNTNAAELWVSAIISSSGQHNGDRFILYFDDNLSIWVDVSTFAPSSSDAARWSINQSPGPLVQTNQPTLLVLQLTNLSLTTHRVNLFVNPMPGLPLPQPNATYLSQGPRMDRVKSVWYIVNGGGTHHAIDEIRFGPSFSAVAPENPWPVIATQPQSQDVAAGAPSTLSVRATGNAPLAYQWFKNGQALAGARSPTFSISAVSFADAGTYYCQVKNTLGQATSANAVLTVHEALLITTQPQSQTVHEGDLVTLSVFATGTWPLSYQWFKDGQALAGGTQRILTLPQATLSDFGEYFCLVANAYGQTASSIAVLTVNPPVFEANLLAYENFIYPEGTQLYGRNGGLGWSSAWAGGAQAYNYFTNRSSSLVPAALPQYATVGGSAAIDLPPNSGGYISRTLDVATTNGTETWFSFIISPSGAGFQDRLLLYFDDNLQTAVEVGAGYQGLGLPARWDINQSGATTGPFVLTNQPTLLVLQITNISLIAHRLNLYVNPPADLLPASPDLSVLLQGPRLDRVKSVWYVVSGGGTHHAMGPIRVGTSIAAINGFGSLPSAQDDTFVVPNWPLVIPVSALLANDAHSQGRPIFFVGADAATSLGAPIVSGPQPLPWLFLPSPPPLPSGAEDTFTYRISDGAHEVSGIVHLIVVAVPPAPTPNRLAVFPPPPGGGLTLPFNAPDAGTYALERKPLAPSGGVGGTWTELTRAMLTGPGLVGFVDGPPASGALYRMRSVP